MATENGGPAFPSAVPNIAQNSTTGETTQYQYLSDGMTLRDYFAAKAVAGMLARNLIASDADMLARDAFTVADAMIKARGQ